MHFCQDELFAILAAIPMLSGALVWLRSKMRRRPKCACTQCEPRESAPDIADARQLDN